MKKNTNPVIIGTRGSELALWQANLTKSILEKNGYQAELKIIKTKGDATQQWNLSFDKMEGKGFFTKELEDALLSNEIDMAVHSCKDMPTENAQGLTLTAFSKRANPFDILLIRKEKVDRNSRLKLKQNAIVGTSSARRKAQLLALRPDFNIQDLRGNVPSRIHKLSEEKYDAIVLASAGIERLNIDISAFEQVVLKAPAFIPAPAQGVLAFQIREADERMKEICSLLNDDKSAEIAAIERQILHDFEGGCQMPLGVYAEKIKEETHVWISQAKAWNTFPKRKHVVLPNDELNNIPKAIEPIVLSLKNSTPTAVFISSDLQENDYIVRGLKALDYTVNYATLIDFSPINFDLPKEIDWLFFSSKNGVKYFFDTVKNISPTIKIAAVNKGTARAILELGYPVDFIGQGGDIANVSQKFDETANGKIIFIQAKNSLRSIQKSISKNKDIHTLIVYENTPKASIKKRTEQILVFTSPMNVEAYLTNYPLEKNQSIISIGTSTSDRLKSLGYADVKTAFEPTYMSIMDEII